MTNRAQLRRWLARSVTAPGGVLRVIRPNPIQSLYRITPRL